MDPVKENLKLLNSIVDLLIRERAVQARDMLANSQDIALNAHLRSEYALCQHLRRTLAAAHLRNFPEERQTLEKVFGEGFDKPKEN